MFTVDAFKNKEPLSLYLSNPQGRIITSLNDGIDVSDSNLSLALNQQFELTFTYNSKYTDKNGELKDSPGYEYLTEGMYLVLEKIGLFKMSSPTILNDGTMETKSITAKSCDRELEDKIFTAQINMGEQTSQEYLVTYEEGETETLLNEYTTIPYDWIVLYNTFPEQLTTLYDQYISGYFGEPNTEIVLTDAERIKIIQDILDLIPRLKSKIYTKADEEETEVIDRLDTVLITYAEDESIESLTIYPEFPQRIQELIPFYTKYRNQLSLLSLALEKMEGNWSVGDIYGLSDGDYTLCNTKCQFDVNEEIYAFLTQTLATAIECVISFDIIHRKVNVTPAEKIGEDTGITLSYETLVNSVNISCDEADLCSRLYVYGADGLNIAQVNFGEEWITDLTYKLSARDNDGNRIFVTDELAEKYETYQQFRNDNRDTYIKQTKIYNQALEDISEIENRVPNDDLKNDWGKYSKELLEEQLTTYNNLLVSLITLYKEDYGFVGLNEDGSVNEEYLKTTEYWHDYKAYQEIIGQIEVALEVWPNYSDETKWNEADREAYLDQITAYQREWSLYGTIELQNKIDDYNNRMSTLVDEEAVLRISEDSDEIKAWNDLSDQEKTKYGGVSIEYDNAVKLYNEYLEDRNGAQNYFDTVLTPELERLTAIKDAASNEIDRLKETVSYKLYFTEEERKILNLLYRDAEYTNEHILTTSLDTSVTTVDVQYELLQDAIEKLAIYSRPQLNFESEIDNIFGLTDYAALWDDFKLGNYIYVEFRDGTYMKVRLVSYQINPFDPDINNLSVGFSSFIVSKSKRSDLLSLLNMSVADGVSRYSSSGSGGSGNGFMSEYLSNTMIEKLLNSETFGSRITNVILDTAKLNEVISSKGIFGALYGDTFNFANGKLVYDGNDLTLQGHFVATTLEATQSGQIACWKINSTSIYKPADNTENAYKVKNAMYFGESGLSISDVFHVDNAGKLTATNADVKGVITATSGAIGGFTLLNGKLYTNGHSAYNTAVNGVYIGSDYVALGSGGKFRVDNTGKLVATDATINGNITATEAHIYKKVYMYTDLLGDHCILRSEDYDALGNMGVYRPRLHIGEECDSVIIKGIDFNGLDNILDATACGIQGDWIASNTDISCKQLSVYDLDATGIHNVVDIKSGNISIEYGKHINSYNSNGEMRRLIRIAVPSSTQNESVILGNTNMPIHIYTIGNVYKNNSTTYFATTGSSDIRLKKDISMVDSSFEDFYLSTEVKTFRYKLDDSEYHFGFMAQDVMENAKKHNLPWLNTNLYGSYAATKAEKDLIGDDTIYNIDYIGWIPLNTHMIQKAFKRIQELENEIKELKQSIV